MSADRFHIARGTGTMTVNERDDGAWYADPRDVRRDPDVEPFERWFDERFMPVVAGVGVWFVIPLVGWLAVWNVVRVAVTAWHH